MRRLAIHAFVLAVALVLASVTSAAQDGPALSVSPTKVNMLVGETHVFRAVGRDGRLRHNVRWSIIPERTASLSQNGDEAMVQALEVSSMIVLTAYSEGDTAEGEIEILPGNERKIGSVIWSVKELPGCKDKKIIPAVPSAGGPDIYVQEDCPQGTVVRAITEDGRELWRRLFASSGAAATELSKKTDTVAGQRIDPHNTSVCDSIPTGMSRDEAGKVIAGRNLHLDDKQRAANLWQLEEDGFHCTISFDATTGTVVKKKKTVVID